MASGPRIYLARIVYKLFYHAWIFVPAAGNATYVDHNFVCVCALSSLAHKTRVFFWIARTLKYNEKGKNEENSNAGVRWKEKQEKKDEKSKEEWRMRKHELKTIFHWNKARIYIANSHKNNRLEIDLSYGHGIPVTIPFNSIINSMLYARIDSIVYIRGSKTHHWRAQGLECPRNLIFFLYFFSFPSNKPFLFQTLDFTCTSFLTTRWFSTNLPRLLHFPNFRDEKRQKRGGWWPSSINIV